MYKIGRVAYVKNLSTMIMKINYKLKLMEKQLVKYKTNMFYFIKMLIKL